MSATSVSTKASPDLRGDPGNALDCPHMLVSLAALMAATEGSPQVSVAVIDGPVDHRHPALAGARITSLGQGMCDPPDGTACRHGTFIAGLLAASRNSAPPGICPGCSLLVRPVFTTREANFVLPSAEPEELATAIAEAVEAGARVVNLSVALLGPDAPTIQTALDYAMRRGVLVTAASGNQGVIGSTAITRHPWVIPVVACDGSGWPLAVSNLSASAGRNGMLAPGEGIVGLTAGGGFHTASGTSVAVPFVSGALALLASLCPWANPMELRRAITTRGNPRRAVVPPLFDAAAAWRALREGRR